MKIFPGYVMLVRNKGIVAAIISWVTKSPYNHIAMFVNHHLLVEANGEGVHLITLKVYEERKAKGQTEFEICRLKDGSLDAKKAVKFAEQFIGDEYDFWQIFKNLFRFVFQTKRTENDRRWTCSELVAEAYAAGGVRILPTGLDFVSPGTFWRSDLMEPADEMDVLETGRVV